ncbi:RICIN domain-containing protein [Streptomyces sp. MS06]|uniref:RICIN domain-containing protein n=1 Tax=Streptomyces sp. MS06 TaxID=3385974 RepID=UPI0039A32B3D
MSADSRRPDEELVRLIGTSAGGQRARAEAEFTARHRSAARAYAGLCCREDPAAEDFAREVFDACLQALRAGSDPGRVRPWLMSAARRTAARWYEGARGGDLGGDATGWLEPLAQDGGLRAAVAAQEEDAPLLRALRGLPPIQQAAVWHMAVDAPLPGASLPPPPDSAGRPWDCLTGPARLAMYASYLRSRATDAPRRACRHLTAALGESVSQDPAHPGDELGRHLAACEDCTRAESELRALHTGDRARLAAALLWPLGPLRAPVPTPAEHAAPPAPRRAGGLPGEGAGDGAVDGGGTRAGHPAVKSVAAGAVVTALVMLGALVSMSGSGAVAHRAGEIQRWPLVVTNTPRARAGTPPAAPSPTPGGTLRTRRPSPARAPGGPSATASSSTARPGGGDGRFVLVNRATGLCVGAGDGAQGALRLEDCATGAVQVWERAAAGGGSVYRLRGAGSGTCLDGTARPGNIVRVEMRSCAALGDTRQLWRFEPSGDPAGSYRVFLVHPVTGSDYAEHLLGPEHWAKSDPPGAGTFLAHLPNYYSSPSFLFVLRPAP